MKNIFENAYFGKAYKTRDGRKAVLISYNQRRPDEPYVCAVACYLNESIKSNCYNFNEFGKRRYGATSNYDIVSEWEEEIDEEELDRLAEEYIQGFDYAIEISPNLLSLKKDRALAKSMFKVGYKAAKKGE